MLEPTWKQGDCSLYLGDCLEILPQLEAGSVDAIITDLPYGTTACSWDEIIPFEPMWAQVKRLLKERGAFVTTASQPFTSKLVMSNLEWFKYEWIWNKISSSNPANSTIAPKRAHENIIVFSENGHKFNPIMRKATIQRKKRGSKKRQFAPGRSQDYSDDFTLHGDDSIRYPISIIDYHFQAAECNNTKRKHPTQKPKNLYEYLIYTYTDSGDTVIDFCFGSGTTGVACVQTGRRFIGVEIEPKYFDIAVKRISQAQLQMRLPI